MLLAAVELLLGLDMGLLTRSKLSTLFEFYIEFGLKVIFVNWLEIWVKLPVEIILSLAKYSNFGAILVYLFFKLTLKVSPLFRSSILTFKMARD